MALSGTVNTSNYQGRYVQLTWTATQSIENNSSTLTWTLKGAGDATSTWYMAGGFYVEINGSVVCDWSTDTRIKLYNGTSITSGQITIPHSSDGAKSFTIGVSAGIYYYERNCSGSEAVYLDTIPRASTISFASGNNSTIGVTNGVKISVSKKSSSFTHTIVYAFGKVTGTICSKSSSTSIQWTAPMSLCNQIPKATSGTGALQCTTYNGNTNVGSKTITMKLNVPSSVKPTLNSMDVTLDNSSNSTVNAWGLYVAGFSKAKITASATGSYSSTISGFTIEGGYSTTVSGTGLSYTGSAITNSGDVTFKVKAKDTRGRYSDVSTRTVTVYPYSVPTISSFSARRSSTSSRNVVVRANWTYSSVNGKNSSTATLYYKKSTSTGWTTYGTISKDTDITLTTEFAEESGYNFRVIVRDSLGNAAQEESMISTLGVLMDFRAGGKGLGIGKIAETDSVEIALDVKFMGNVYIYDDDGNSVTLADYIKSVV